MSRVKNFALTFALSTCVLAVGLVAGYLLRGTLSKLQSDAANQTDSHAGHAHGGHSSTSEGETDEQHIDLTKHSFKNLGMKVGKVTLGEYFRHLRIPAEIVERPGLSDYTLAAPVGGTITKVHATPGQSVRPGDAVFDLRVTDESLIEAQLALLETLARIDVVDVEINRLTPLAQSGSVPGRRLLDLQYERQQLASKKHVRIQELIVRGLNRDQVDSVISQQQLIRTLVVRMPEAEALKSLTMPISATSERRLIPESTDWDLEEFTIEHLDSILGQTIARGADFCHMAYHARLYIRGRAFEHEIDSVALLSRKGWKITADFGIERNVSIRKGLTVHYLENHVDEDSQTFNFYVAIQNEVIHDQQDQTGNRFRSWRFKPGQRVHLRIPIEKWTNQIVVPIEAVVREGAEAFVFRQRPRKGTDVYVFDRKSVQVVHQDTRHAVLANDRSLIPGHTIALNNAYQLNMSLKVDSGSPAGHGHSH